MGNGENTIVVIVNVFNFYVAKKRRKKITRKKKIKKIQQKKIQQKNKIQQLGNRYFLS